MSLVASVLTSGYMHYSKLFAQPHKARSRIVLLDHWYVVSYALYVVYKSIPLTLLLYSVVDLVSNCGENHGDWIDRSTSL
jgi:hypothetical protein